MNRGTVALDERWAVPRGLFLRKNCLHESCIGVCYGKRKNYGKCLFVLQSG